MRSGQITFPLLNTNIIRPLTCQPVSLQMNYASLSLFVGSARFSQMSHTLWICGTDDGRSPQSGRWSYKCHHHCARIPEKAIWQEAHREGTVGDVVMLKYTRKGPGHKPPLTHSHKLAALSTSVWKAQSSLILNWTPIKFSNPWCCLDSSPLTLERWSWRIETPPNPRWSRPRDTWGGTNCWRKEKKGQRQGSNRVPGAMERIYCRWVGLGTSISSRRSSGNTGWVGEEERRRLWWMSNCNWRSLSFYFFYFLLSVLISLFLFSVSDQVWKSSCFWEYTFFGGGVL